MRRETYTGDDVIYLDLHQIPEPVQAWVSSLPIMPDAMEFILIKLTYSYSAERVLVGVTHLDDAEVSETQDNMPEDLLVETDGGDQFIIPFALWQAHRAEFRSLVAGEENFVS